MILELPVTLANRYKVERLLGAGSFAETYLARDEQDEQEVAVKVLRPQFVSHRETLIRFEREARATSEIYHPNVVRTLDYNMSGEHPFLVMEYVPGPDLKGLLQERGTFSPEEAVTLAVQILAGLDAIHQTGMIHRDAKPHNVLTDPEHGARLCDFSIARAVDQTGLTRTGIALGTASYMAPEQATGREVTPATDLYAAGVIMFEMLTGRVPFSGNDPLEVLYQQVHNDPPSLREINPAVPAWLEAIVLRAMSKEPADRFASANDMIQALNSGYGSEDATRAMDPALLAAQAATAAMPARPARSKRPVRAVPDRRPAPPAAAAPPPSRPRTASAAPGSRWYRTPAIILAALLVVGIAIGTLYGLGTWEGTNDDEPATLVDEPEEDDDPPVEEPVPTAPPEDETPQEPEPAEPAPEVEEPVEEEEVEQPQVEEPPPEEEEDADAPEQNDTEDDQEGNQGSPPPHAGGAQGEEQGQAQGQGQDNPGQGNENPGQGQGQEGDNPGQGGENPGQGQGNN